MSFLKNAKAPKTSTKPNSLSTRPVQTPKAPIKSKNPNPFNKFVRVPKLNLDGIICPNAPIKSKNPLNYSGPIPKFDLGISEESQIWDVSEEECLHVIKKIKSISYLPSGTSKPLVNVVYYK